MFRTTPALLVGALFIAAVPARAADAPAGSWKLTIPGTNLTFLFSLEQKGGKWTGQFLGATVPEFPKVNISDAVVSPDGVRLTFKLPGQDLTFDGRLPPDKNGRIAGSLGGAGRLVLIHVEPSKLKTFDKYEFAREAIDQSAEAQVVADAAFELVKQAGDKKTKIEEVRGWADKAFRAAEAYGPRWQRSVATKLAQGLVAHKDFGTLAVEYARKLERTLADDEDTVVQMDVIGAVIGVLTKAGKADDAKDLQARLLKLEEKDFAEYAKTAPFKADQFGGRKGRSDRAVLVELFTGAECPPCVAADVAFDALGKTYKPDEVVLLQYHVHIPGPDPLSNADTIARLQYYGNKVRGTPTVFFNGKPGTGGGGPLTQARKSYADFRDAIEPLLEKAADAKIQLSAEKKGQAISIKANVSDLAKSGESIRLRFALVEENIRYQGSNNLRYHHWVVRAMPGGAKGFALTKKSAEQTATVDVDELRKKLNEYLDDFASQIEEGFPKPDRPMQLKKLRVVALIQDDDTNEVLQAAQVAVKE